MIIIDTIIYCVFAFFIGFVFAVIVSCICIDCKNNKNISEDEDEEQINYLIDWKEKHNL